ncbi:hypothetical protein DFS34DRAFT_379290 [Phlyctochytrium arcticum]|nr:hypothetical protein DFS34DRAFT_379290 [Phlyctochytrium arcticum]
MASIISRRTTVGLLSLALICSLSIPVCHAFWFSSGQPKADLDDIYDDDAEFPTINYNSVDPQADALMLRAASFARRNLYWMLPTILILLALDVWLLVYAAGKMLKEEFVVVRAIKLEGQALGNVWRVLTHWEGLKDWRTGVVEVTDVGHEDRQDAIDPKSRVHKSQLGEQWTLLDKQRNAMKCVVTEVEQESLLVVTQTPMPSRDPWPLSSFHAAIQQSTWTIELRSQSSLPKSCIVYVTQQGKIASPMWRLILALLGHGPAAEELLTDLARHVGQEGNLHILKPIDGKLVVEE